MKKFISYVGLLLVSASLLVGCKKAEDQTSPPAPASTNKAPATT